MTDAFQNLKEELSTLYPDIIETEIDHATKNLIEFFVLGIKLLSKSNDINPLTDIDDV